MKLVSLQKYLRDQYSLSLNSATDIRILDDGEEFKFYLNGQSIGDRFSYKQLATATGLGIAIQASPNLYLHQFEAHPRTVTIRSLELDCPWWREGTNTVIKDDFQVGGDLAGKATDKGDRIWQKTIGKGDI